MKTPNMRPILFGTSWPIGQHLQFNRYGDYTHVVRVTLGAEGVQDPSENRNAIHTYYLVGRVFPKDISEVDAKELIFATSATQLETTARP